MDFFKRSRRRPAPAHPAERAGVLRGGFLWVTIGSCALVFLAAFENIAVTAVMPAVSAGLDGARWYALAFAGPLATGVIGMVAAGLWADRRGPIAPLYTSVGLFGAGLVVCGLAPAMEVLVAGRLLQGLGGGAITVALYVVVGRIYPERLQPKLFAGFAACWIVPALVGPAIAGTVAELLGWQWVFLGVVGLVAVAMVMVVPALRGTGGPQAAEEGGNRGFGLLGWAALAAAAVLALNLAGGLPRVGGALSVVAIAVALAAVRPLLPRGTLTARHGLPSVILTRGLVSAAFFGGDVYLPYLLTEKYGFAPAFAGLTLTVGGLAWAGASTVQGRLGDRMSHAAGVRIGSALVLGSLLGILVTVALALPAAVAIVAWGIGGAGMGLMFPRLSTLMLGLSAPAERGFASSAGAIADSLGGALSLAVGGLVFSAAFGGFTGVFALSTAVGLVAVVVAQRAAAPAGLPASDKRTMEVAA
ncbi:putative MFS family arabinose efflux permease [Actinocorallia herbida]|uniref:Putative MFS family arabinose efflux permease n=1 Tax=Actinocorallia herbida TaxID=58109 RepID=A0A3N1DBY5_9ACTN|nr:MFS transporter [Actinocorallia herbida]ROO91033.1 putative MFS family arabinose efflux permease [Actinocorallia herbida]